MIEHNRVLDAFRNCITVPKCKDCPWTECSTLDNGCVEIPRDLALAVMRELTAQEPRVMTMDEYEAWIDTPFTERNPVFHEERTKRGTVTSWVNTTVCTLREYGKNDRCWTSRPTDEQRQATPWIST